MHGTLLLSWNDSLTKITEVNLSVFVYRLFHEDFSPILGTNHRETLNRRKLMKPQILALWSKMFSIVPCCVLQFNLPKLLHGYVPGDMYDHESLCRAVCCRINEAVNEHLPPPFKLHHPYLGRVSIYQISKDVGNFPSHSINWCADDEKIEIVDGATGHATIRYFWIFLCEF